MKNKAVIFVHKMANYFGMGLCILAVALMPRKGEAALTITVVDDGGNPITNGYRWILQ
jgi:hypothetical protein